MNYFHDSGVILGFIFRGADRWGEQACKKIEDSIPNHSGRFVWEECFGAQFDDGSFYKGKCGWLRKEIMRESRRIVLKIEQKVPLPDIILEIKKSDYHSAQLIEILFKKFGNTPDFIKNFKEAFIQFDALCYQRYCVINDGKIIQKHNRRKGYIEIYDFLKKHIQNEIDIEIIIDGHHLATQIPKVLFITGDRGDIYSNRQNILKITSLSDVIWLRNT